MKVRYQRPTGDKAKQKYEPFWYAPFCEVINAEKYDENYSRYLVKSVWKQRFSDSINRELYEISRVEREEIECFKTGTEIFTTYVYKDRVEFICNWEDEEWPNWSCTVEEYKRVLLGQKTFLMLPKEPESYLEIKINDIE